MPPPPRIVPLTAEVTPKEGNTKRSLPVPPTRFPNPEKLKVLRLPVFGPMICQVLTRLAPTRVFRPLPPATDWKSRNRLLAPPATAVAELVWRLTVIGVVDDEKSA